MRGVRLGPIAILLTFLACEAPPEIPNEPENQPTGTPTAIDPAPILSLGVREGDPLQEFFRVTSPFLLPDGRVGVPLQGESVVRIFDLSGTHLEDLGGEGEGPGEFSRLGTAWPRGDTVEAFDLAQSRITRFHPDGEVEVVQLDRVSSAQAIAPGWYSSGGWLAYGVASISMGGRDVWAVHWFDRQGEHIGEITQVEGFIRLALEGGGSMLHPISPKAFFGVDDTLVYVGESPNPAIEVYAPTGASVGQIRLEPTSLSAEEVVAMVRDTALARASTEGAATVRARFDQMEGVTLSVAWDMLIDEVGFIWIRSFDPLVHSNVLGGGLRPGPGGEWMIFSPEWERVGMVRMPDGLEPTQITVDHVIGTSRDDLGIESVHVFRIDRR